jgi:hypothetical protein
MPVKFYNFGPRTLDMETQTSKQEDIDMEDVRPQGPVLQNYRLFYIYQTFTKSKTGFVFTEFALI